MMRARRGVTLAALALALALAQAQAQAQAQAAADAPPGALGLDGDAQTLTWLVGDAGLSRSDPSGRPSDQLLDWLAERLPDLRQPRVAANAQRSWHLLAQGEPVCGSNLVRTPQRERQVYYSNTAPFATPQVYVRPERAGALPRDGQGEVDLPALLADARLRGGGVLGRSYGVTIDAWLSAAGEASGLQRLAAADFGSNLLPMLALRRVDYVIEYPAALMALAARHPAVRDLTGLPIAGTEKLLTVGVACPRTAWGRAMIRRVDKVLSTPEGVAMLRKGMEQEMPREVQRALAERIDAFFARRARPSPDL